MSNEMKKDVAMNHEELEKVLEKVHGETEKEKCDGTRVHIHYKSFGRAIESAKEESRRAEDLGLPKDRYTGRVVKIWETKSGDKCMTMIVELERDKKFRTFNFNKGTFYKFVILGD